MKPLKNLYLIGPMGAGKTSIGKQLAKSLRFDFFDMDQVIAETTGVDIAWLFDVEGEAGFRLREQEALKKLVHKQRIVLSTGGGVIGQAQNRQLLAAHGTVLYLSASVAHLAQRIMKKIEKRPMLSTGEPEERLRQLASERNSLYASIADFTVYTGDQSVSAMTKNIIQLLQHAGYRW